MSARSPWIVFIFLSVLSLFGADQTNSLTPRADGLFKQQNWAEARSAYDDARAKEKDWSKPLVRVAVEGAVACSIQLEEWDDAFERAQQFVAKTKGTYEEAIGERFLGGLYMTAPHHGTKRAGKFLRGQWGQGVHVNSWRKDRNASVQHYERARDLLNGFAKNKNAEAERIGVDFDLAAVLARHDEYRGYGGWDWWWGSDEEEDSQAVEEADYEEARMGRWWNQEEKKPIGIPLAPDGKPQFPTTPAKYSADLGAGAKVRFLLQEIQQLDHTKNKDDGAKALFRRAMINRTLYGPESINNVAQPEKDKPLKRIWELSDDEALTIVGGKVAVVTLPKSENTIALLRDLVAKFPQSSSAGDAQYSLALFYQSRQQFPEAIREYEAFLEKFPQHTRVKSARAQIARMKKPEVFLGQTGINLPDQKPKLSFSYRNADSVAFKARRIDLVKYIRDQAETRREDWWNYRNVSQNLFADNRWTNYVRAIAATWTEAVKRESGNRAAEGSTLAPLSDPGAYVVEARVAGNKKPTRVLVLVTDIAIVQKNLAGKGLVYVCDARTGQPLANRSVRFYEHWNTYDQTNRRNSFHWDSTVKVTDTNGVVEYTLGHQEHSPSVDAIVTGESNRMAFSFFQNWGESDYWASQQENGPRFYIVTDRPVYRPGDTVRFRVWMRYLENRTYKEPRGDESVLVEVYDAKSNVAQKKALKTDASGCISDSFELGHEPPLGVYNIRVNGTYPDAHGSAGGLFRVEEYKKPEFEVMVKPSKSTARLGERIKARIEARYYYGAPVAKAKVTYKVFREDYHHVYFGAGEYDWLYGKGYGYSHYAYPWFPWWHRWCYWQTEFAPEYSGYPSPYNRGYPYETTTRKALRELVSQGEGELAADGSYEVEINTSKAKAELPDSDHRYTVEAEVRDASRRTIEGQGSVLVTRQEFYAFVESNAGWYQPRNEAFFQVRTLTPNNEPIASKGEVVVYRISYKDSLENETVVQRWDAETDADGRLSFKYPIPSEGQYRVAYVTHDSQNKEVLGNAVFWVNGPKFDGRVYRFNDLEIIADKRTYQIGDVAHLLINTAENNARILFSDEVAGSVLKSYRFLDLPARSTVVDIPIEKKHVPNFFVEATLVRGGRMHNESRELFVPPSEGLLNVQVTSDRQTYKPGETGKVSVVVTDSSSKPAKGQVTLTGYDRAVTYIQDEFGPSPRVFYYGQKRYHQLHTEGSVDETFQPSGEFDHPEYASYEAQPPTEWYGNWSISLDGLEFKSENGLEQSRRAVAVTAIGGSFAADSLSFVTKQAAPASAPAGGVALYGMAKEEPQRAAGALLVEPELRVNFADTALWQSALQLDDRGRAETNIVFPQSLTTWRLHAYALSAATQVGDATNEVKTSKNLLVQLESPRFFVERDEVVLSANVHNYLKSSKKVRAELIIPSDLFDSSEASETHKDGNRHFFAESKVDADGEHRFDWPVKVSKAGLARITVKALTDEESDGMRMTFPVLVHGVMKTVAQSGSYRVSQDGARTLNIDIPKQIDPEQTKVEVTLSPSLGGVLIDALPYLAGYPYGCVEQTVSRFYPSVLVRDTMKRMGTDLEAIAKQHKQMNPADVTNRFGRFNSPVFDSAELDRMVKAGLERIYNFQRNDGGWGWWREDDSSPFQTSYVLQGLHAAIQAEVDVDRGVYDRGFEFLRNDIDAELAKPKDKQQLGDTTTQAGIAYTLSLEHRIQSEAQKQWLTGLYTNRAELNNYGRALLALTMKNEQRMDEAKMLLRNLLQFVDRDDSNETAWVRTPQAGWWFWWNNDIEANAWALKALVAIDPQNDLGPRLVKWLLNNRKNGYYWRSTRDTALVISAMVDYMRASGEAAPDYSLTLEVDGRAVKEIKITKENFFTFDNRFVLSGLQIKPGAHKISFKKNGKGALHYSAYVGYFTKEEDVRGAGNEIFVDRKYFKLIPRTEKVQLGKSWWGDDKVKGHTEVRDGFERVPLKNGDTLASGDKLEVVLNITAKNSYDFLAFEDMKPSGCEPVELRSGGRWAGGLCANLELRDEKVVFFIGLLEQGEHVLRYKLRAETPGHFHALPTKAFAMYAPEIKAISDEMRLKIKE
jgi:alpha-2-macroglobulin